MNNDDFVRQPSFGASFINDGANTLTGPSGSQQKSSLDNGIYANHRDDTRNLPSDFGTGSSLNYAGNELPGGYYAKSGLPTDSGYPSAFYADQAHLQSQNNRDSTSDYDRRIPLSSQEDFDSRPQAEYPYDISSFGGDNRTLQATDGDNKLRLQRNRYHEGGDVEVRSQSYDSATPVRDTTPWNNPRNTVLMESSGNGRSTIPRETGSTSNSRVSSGISSVST